LSPYHLASLRHATSLGKAMEGKYFFRYRKNEDFFYVVLFALLLLAYAFHTWAVRSQTGRYVYTRIHKAVQRKLRMKEKKKVKEISK
jgi:hypothetical protein